jgi:epi-isozizaene synthase
MMTVPPELRIPMIEQHFTRQFHQLRWSLRATTRRWMVERRLLTDEIAPAYTETLLHYPDLISGYYVGAAGPVIRAILDFSAWFFCWDDYHGRAAATARDTAWRQLSHDLRKALAAPTAHRAHPTPLVAGFAEVMSRMFADRSEQWTTRFRQHMTGIVNAYDCEYRNQRTRRVLPVAEYLELRRWTFGHDVWIDLLESAASGELPADVYHHPLYQASVNASLEFSSTYNDLCSLDKEIAAGELHNLGICLMRHTGLDPDQARTAVRDRAAQRVAAFLAAEADLTALLETDWWPPEVTATGRTCLVNARNWISSVYWFHHESARYKVADWADPTIPPYIPPNIAGGT